MKKLRSLGGRAKQLILRFVVTGLFCLGAVVQGAELMASEPPGFDCMILEKGGDPQNAYSDILEGLKNASGLLICNASVNHALDNILAFEGPFSEGPIIYYRIVDVSDEFLNPYLGNRLNRIFWVGTEGEPHYRVCIKGMECDGLLAEGYFRAEGIDISEMKKVFEVWFELQENEGRGISAERHGADLIENFQAQVARLRPVSFWGGHNTQGEMLATFRFCFGTTVVWYLVLKELDEVMSVSALSRFPDEGYYEKELHLCL